MMIRSTFSTVLWLIPAIFLAAIFLAACTSSSNPAEEVNRPLSTESDPDTTAEALPGPSTTAASEDSPTPTSRPSPEPDQATVPPEATAPLEASSPLQEAAPLLVALPDLGLAPDITNEVWLNTDQPLNLAALQGRVVLVEFWTFG